MPPVKKSRSMKTQPPLQPKEELHPVPCGTCGSIVKWSDNPLESEAMCKKCIELPVRAELPASHLKQFEKVKETTSYKAQEANMPCTHCGRTPEGGCECTMVPYCGCVVQKGRDCCMSSENIEEIVAITGNRRGQIPNDEIERKVYALRTKYRREWSKRCEGCRRTIINCNCPGGRGLLNLHNRIPVEY